MRYKIVIIIIVISVSFILSNQIFGSADIKAPFDCRVNAVTDRNGCSLGCQHITKNTKFGCTWLCGGELGHSICPIVRPTTINECMRLYVDYLDMAQLKYGTTIYDFYQYADERCVDLPENDLCALSYSRMVHFAINEDNRSVVPFEEYMKTNC